MLNIGVTRILLVESDATTATALGSFLGMNGLAVDRAADTPEAMRLLRGGGGYSIVVIDVKLSDRSGLDLLEWLHKSMRELLKRTVVISGDKSESVIEQLGLLDICDIVPKPVDAAQILAAVRDCLRDAKSHEVN